MDRDLLTDKDLQTKKKPSRQWRNKYYSLIKGTTFFGWGIWPSKEIAEQHAIEATKYRQNKSEYLGAFPIE